MVLRGTLLLAGLLACAASARATPPVAYIEKVSTTPDLGQRSRLLPDSGRQYCAPVAVSNSFVWLARHGFGRLLPRAGQDVDRQLELARLLGSPPYMNTGPRGTGPTGVLRGVARYLADRGYVARHLEYQGWRRVPPGYGTPRTVPELAWLKQGLQSAGAVWINVGWYRHDPRHRVYERIGGHWVTLVGYGVGADGRSPDPNVLIVHDPGVRAGQEWASEFVRAEPIRRGLLVGPGRGLPRPASGYHVLGNGMHLKRGADVAILDGAVVVQL